MAQASLSCTTAYIGTAPTITILSPKQSYTHTLTYVFNGTVSGTIATNTSETTITNFNWPIDLYYAIPNSQSGEGVITCKTYEPGSGGYTLICTTTCTFTAKAIPEYCEPTISALIKDTNESTIKLTGDSSKLIRYHSTAQVNVTAEGKVGASIVSQYVTNGGKQLHGETVSFEKVESESFSIYAKDSRDLSVSVGRDLSVAGRFVKYIRPTCYMSNTRPDTDGNMSVICYGNFFNGSFGAVTNDITAEYRYNYGEWKPMTVTKNQNNTYSATASLTGLDYQTTYVFETRVTDKLETVASTSSSVKSLPVFHWGENDFVFEVPVALKGGISGGVEGDVNVTGDLRLKGIGNYGNTLRFGDADYCYITETPDDVMTIKAKNIFINPDNAVYINGKPLPITTCDFWSPELNPAVVSSYTTQFGWYTKFNQTVTVGFCIKATCRSGYDSTTISISGLPFTPLFNAAGGGMCSGAYVSGGFNFQCFVAETSGTITTRVQACNNTSATNLSTSASGCCYRSGGGEITLSGTITYMSNS
jgi:hypothetical protein